MERKRTRSDRKPRGFDGSRDVGGSQTRIQHAHKQNFKPAAPTSGDTKGGLAPLVACVSPADWREKDVGGGAMDIQLPTTHGVTINSDCRGEWDQGKKIHLYDHDEGT